MAKTIQIVRLSLVARAGRSPVYIGWDSRGNPVTSDELSEEANQDFLSAKQSGSSFPSVPTSDILCFEYTSLGTAIDYPGSKEDIIPINAKDGSGNSAVLNLGEGTLLKAIEWSLNADNIWNSISGIGLFSDGSGVNSTISIYTLLFQDSRVENGAVCALLFKPIFKGNSNENTFERFVKGVVKQLLVIDESQPPRHRKGYIQVAAKASRSGSKTGFADLIFDTSDRKTAAAIGNAKASGLKLLETLGLVEVPDEVIQAIEDPLPNYNVENLDMDGLSDLITSMRELAPYRSRS